jgi:DNA-binding response OmpR family regulator
MKILIVEDDPRIASPLAKDLRYQHHGVDVAEDGVEGWDYASSGSLLFPVSCTSFPLVMACLAPILGGIIFTSI